MRKRILGLPALLALLAAPGGCAQDVIVGVNPGSGGGAGSGTGGAYTSRLIGPQPGMVAVPSPGGVMYSIDSTEVSQAAYALFLESDPKADPSSAYCSGKTSFAPGFVEVDPIDPESCQPTNTYYDPVATGNDPVVCVDWCDAVAYCQWAGKRLCGHIGGGPATEPEFADATASQWYNACSNGGTTPFPYGPAFVPDACNWGPTVAAVGQRPGCHGEAAPLTGVFDMSGNVGEWEDNCTPNADPFGPGDTVVTACMVRGGNFILGPLPPPGGPVPAGLELICGTMLDGANTGVDINYPTSGSSNTGFRCCTD